MTEISNDTMWMETFYSDFFIEETKVKNNELFQHFYAKYAPASLCP